MPAKGKSKVTDAQRRKIAAGRIAGKTAKEMALEVDLHPMTVARIATDRRTQTIILGLKQKSEQDFAEMWLDMIAGMKEDINSKDFNTRSITRAQFLRVVTAGDPPLYRVGDAGGGGGDFTLEELLATMRAAGDVAA